MGGRSRQLLRYRLSQLGGAQAGHLNRLTIAANTMLAASIVAHAAARFGNARPQKRLSALSPSSWLDHLEACQLLHANDRHQRQHRDQ